VGWGGVVMGGWGIVIWSVRVRGMCDGVREGVCLRVEREGVCEGVCERVCEGVCEGVCMREGEGVSIGFGGGV
jgi:hypothetical protein